MTNMPWGPHGQQAPPHTVRQNPTPADAPMNIGGGEGYGSGMAAGGDPGPVGTFLVNLVVSLVLVALLWIPILCLYPLSALAGLLSGFVSHAVLLRVLPADGQDVAAVLSFGIGCVVGWNVYRRGEYVAADRPAFRHTRHLVRMVLLAIWAMPIILLCKGVTAPSTSTRFILSIMTSPRAMLWFLVQPVNLVLWLAALAGLHFLLTKGLRMREWWHRRLKYIGLK